MAHPCRRRTRKSDPQWTPKPEGSPDQIGTLAGLSAAVRFGPPCLCRVRQSGASRRMRRCRSRRRGQRPRPESPWARCRPRARSCRCRAAAGWRRRSGRRRPVRSRQTSTSIAHAAAIGDADQAGLGHGLAGKRVEPVGGGRPGRPAEARAELPELAVERHARKMRADHHELDRAVVRRADAAGSDAGSGQPVAPSVRPLAAWMSRASAAVSQSLPAARQQGDAHRQAVVALAGRHGDAAHVEQVDEIGVGAEPAVGGDRIGEHGLDACSASARSARRTGRPRR